MPTVTFPNAVSASPTRSYTMSTKLGRGLIIPFGADASASMTFLDGSGRVRDVSVKALIRSQLGLELKMGSSLAFSGKIWWLTDDFDITRPLSELAIPALFHMRQNGTISGVDPALVAINSDRPIAPTRSIKKLFLPGDMIGLHQPIFVPGEECVFDGVFIEKPSYITAIRFSMTSFDRTSPMWDNPATRYLGSEDAGSPSVGSDNTFTVPYVPTNGDQPGYSIIVSQQPGSAFATAVMTPASPAWPDAILPLGTIITPLQIGSNDDVWVTYFVAYPWRGIHSVNNIPAIFPQIAGVDIISSVFLLGTANVWRPEQWTPTTNAQIYGFVTLRITAAARVSGSVTVTPIKPPQGGGWDPISEQAVPIEISARPASSGVSLSSYSAGVPQSATGRTWSTVQASAQKTLQYSLLPNTSATTQQPASTASFGQMLSLISTSSISSLGGVSVAQLAANKSSSAPIGPMAMYSIVQDQQLLSNTVIPTPSIPFSLTRYRIGTAQSDSLLESEVFIPYKGPGDPSRGYYLSIGSTI